MRRKRVTGRFYVFLVLLLIGGYFILRELFPGTAQEAVVRLAGANYEHSVDAVIVRDEEVFSYEGTGRVVFIAAEGASVKEGESVCEVYSVGYSDKEVEKLDSVRKAIRSYHEQILDNIVDSELDRLEQKVESGAVQLKTLIRQKSGGSLLNLEKQLEESMAARQDYLRRNRSMDPKLNQLYDEENRRMTALEPWKNEAAAPCDGIVSFYLDGYENILNSQELNSITFEDVHAILARRKPAQAATDSRLMTSIFRVVSSDKWYVILLSGDPDWNPVSGEVITFKMDGFPDVEYAGTVVRAQKSAGEVMAQLEVNGALGPLFNQRSGSAQIGSYLSGMMVPIRALTEQGGQTGVLLNDIPGGSFIPVEVLYRDSRAGNALVRPLVEGTLEVGQRVLIK